MGFRDIKDKLEWWWDDFTFALSEFPEEFINSVKEKPLQWLTIGISLANTGVILTGSYMEDAHPNKLSEIHENYDVDFMAEVNKRFAEHGYSIAFPEDLAFSTQGFSAAEKENGDVIISVLAKQQKEVGSEEFLYKNILLDMSPEDANDIVLELRDVERVEKQAESTSYYEDLYVWKKLRKEKTDLYDALVEAVKHANSVVIQEIGSVSQFDAVLGTAVDKELDITAITHPQNIGNGNSRFYIDFEVDGIDYRSTVEVEGENLSAHDIYEKFLTGQILDYSHQTSTEAALGVHGHNLNK